MTDKELSKLNRKELLEILLDVSRENDALKEEIDNLKTELSQKDTMISQCGSLSEIIDKIHEAIDQAKIAVHVDNSIVLDENVMEENIIDDKPVEQEDKEIVEEVVFNEIQEDYPYVEQVQNDDPYWHSLVDSLELFVSDNSILKDVVNLDMFKDGDNNE